MAWQGEFEVRPTSRGTARLTSRGVEYLVPTEATFTLRGANDQPDLMARVVLTDGAPVITQLTITSKPQGAPVRNTHLDQLSMDKLARRTLLEMATKIERTETGLTRLSPVGNQTGDMWNVVGALDTAQKTQNRTTTAALLQDVANIYRTHIDASPTRAVADVLGVSQRTAARRVKEAEQAGLLPKTTQGKKRGI